MIRTRQEGSRSLLGGPRRAEGLPLARFCGLLSLAALAACQQNGFVRVTVTEADGGRGFPSVFELRSTATDSDGGTPNVGHGPLSQSALTFPETFVVEVPSSTTSLTEVVEALDSTGTIVLLRGSNSTTFAAGSQAPMQINLSQACASSLDCDPGSFCQGEVACTPQGSCVASTTISPPGFGAPCGNDGGRCDEELACSLQGYLSEACKSSLDCDPAAFCQGQVVCTPQGACVATTTTSPPGFGVPCGNDGGRCDEQQICTVPFGTCGDGVQGNDPLPDGGLFVEQCDWGNGDDGGACTGPNGECNADEPDHCRSTCVLPACGDGIVDTGEKCDLGPVACGSGNGSEHGCNATCTLVGTATRIAGSGDLFPDGGYCTVGCYADGPGNQALFEEVAGIAVAGGSLYVADTLDEVIRAVDLTSPAYTVSTLAGDAGPPPSLPCANTQDGTGNGACFFLPLKPLGYQAPGQPETLLVGTGMDVRQITLDGVVTTLAGPNSGNKASEPTTFPLPSSKDFFNTVTGLAVDPSTGFVYTLDKAGGYIHQIDPATMTDYCLVGADATCQSTSTLEDPTSGVVVNGGLFLSDTGGYDISRVSLPAPDAGVPSVTHVAGSGGAGFADSCAPGGSAFDGPAGVCTDGKTIYIVDQANLAIRQLDPVTYQVTTVIGGPDAGVFANPYDCAWDTDAGVLYVSDQANPPASPHTPQNPGPPYGNVIYMIR